MLKFLRNIFVISLYGLTVYASNEPYCVRNNSVIIRTPVMKTRQIIKKPTGVFKVFKKTKMYTESYEDFEDKVHTELVRNCCDGYRMSRFDICEPICTNGCPKNALCSEPNLCQCKIGYISAVSTKNGSHYCEPICKGGCPSNAHCAEPDVCECERGYHIVENRCVPRCASGCPNAGKCIRPNECECLNGFKAEFGTCVPECTIANGCKNGVCEGLDVCICNAGFEWNEESGSCKKICPQGVCTTDDAIDEDSSTTNTSPLDTTDEDDENDEMDEPGFELDEEEKIFLTSSDNTDDDSTTQTPECPSNYIFYDNICRPKLFASNAIDCKFKPCVEHAFCQDNGTCACEEGYNWYTPENTTTSSEDVRAYCLTQMEIDRLVEEALIVAIDSGEEIDWYGSSFVALGILCIVGALCFLIGKLLLHKRRRNVDVEVKNDLYCSYDRNSKDVPLVL